LKYHLSISLRLTFWFSAMFLLGFLIFGMVMFADLSYSISAGRDKTLSSRAVRVEGLLKTTYNPTSAHSLHEFNEFVAVTPEGNLIRVFDANGVQIYPADKTISQNFPWPAWTIDGRTESSQVTYRNRSYRVLSTSASLRDERFRILIGGQLEDNRVILNHFRGGLFWATPALLIFSSMFGYILSRRALNPMARLISSARSISIGNLSRRLPLSNTRDELQLLAETCNDMLARLETAVNQITRFTADASHELRHPISYIYTLSEYAMRRPEIDEESADSFAEIAREAAEATRLLEDMLALARADAGHVEVAFEQINLLEVFWSSATKSRSLASAKQQTLKIQTDRNEPVWIYGDASSLRRLFLILSDNAIKYTPDKGQIVMSLWVSGSKAYVSVQDSGIGIPPAALPEIFRRFYRVDNARTSSEGTGLGLAIAKWISDIHSAEITVSSIIDSGSTFQLSFSVVS
jgi:signal transduction histidine kinase